MTDVDRSAAQPSTPATPGHGAQLSPLGRSLQSWLNENTTALPALVGLAGALAFAAINVASTIFYEPLGVTPSEVGLGYGELLARVAVIVAVVSATALVAVVAVSLAIWRAAKRLHIESDRRMLLVLIGLGACIVLAIDVLILVPPPINLRPSWADLFGMLTFSSLVAVGVIIGLALWHEDITTRFNITRNGVILMTGVWLLLAPLSFVAHAKEGTAEVQDGHRQRASMFGAPFPWQVTVARVRWNEPRPELETTSSCLLYLGSSEGSSVVYDPQSGRSFRASAGDMVIELRPNDTACPE
jgi:hypothetical protein